METQVLIPQDFSLVLTAPGGRASREQVASVFTTARIPQATVFHPFQGTVRTDKLEIYSYLDEHDVSTNILNVLSLPFGTCLAIQLRMYHNEGHQVSIIYANFLKCTLP